MTKGHGERGFFWTVEEWEALQQAGEVQRKVWHLLMEDYERVWHSLLVKGENF